MEHQNEEIFYSDSDYEYEYDDDNNICKQVFYLGPPPCEYSTFEYAIEKGLIENVHPPIVVNLYKELQVEYEVNKKGNLIFDKNIILDITDIPGWGILSRTYREQQIGILYLTVKKCNPELFEKFQKARKLVVEKEPKKISELYDLLEPLYGLNFMEQRTRAISNILKTNPSEYNDLEKMDEKVYLALTYFHLFTAFRGGKGWLIGKDKNEKPIMIQPTALMLHGQEFWWLLHVACSKLQQMYNVYFGLSRPVSISLLRLSPEAFIWDIVRGWASAVSLVINLCLRESTIDNNNNNNNNNNIMDLIIAGKIDEIPELFPCKKRHYIMAHFTHVYEKETIADWVQSN